MQQITKRWFDNQQSKQQKKATNDKASESPNKYFQSLVRIKDRFINASSVSQNQIYQNSTINSSYNNSLAKNQKSDINILQKPLSANPINQPNSESLFLNQHINRLNHKNNLIQIDNGQQKRNRSQSKTKKYLSVTQRQKTSKTNKSLIVLKGPATINQLKNQSREKITTQGSKQKQIKSKRFLLTQNSVDKFNKSLNTKRQQKNGKEDPEQDKVTINGLHNSIKRYFSNIMKRIVSQESRPIYKNFQVNINQQKNTKHKKFYNQKGQFQPYQQHDHIVNNQNIDNFDQKQFNAAKKATKQRQIISQTFIQTARRRIKTQTSNNNSKDYYNNNYEKLICSIDRSMINNMRIQKELPGNSIGELNTSNFVYCPNKKQNTLTRIDSPILGLLELVQMQNKQRQINYSYKNQYKNLQHNYDHNIFTQPKIKQRAVSQVQKEKGSQQILLLNLNLNQNISSIENTKRSNNNKKIKFVSLIEKQQARRYKNNKNQPQSLKQGFIKLRQKQKVAMSSSNQINNGRSTKI